MAERRELLIVTNDFPPRQGGIQSMIFELASRLPAQSLAVYCSDYVGAREFDRGLSFPVVRHPTGMLLPTPSAKRRVLQVAADFGSTTAWFGAAAPLALLGPSLRARGVQHLVATTHGHEVGWAKLPGGRQALRRIGNSMDVITYLGEYTRKRLVTVLGPHPELRRLHPGVDTGFFSPSVAGGPIRARYNLSRGPVIVCVSRLVPRKGQDALIKALPSIERRHPGVVLLLVGTGPYERQLRALAESLDVGDHVVMTGPVAYAELAAHYAAGDVFAMPCRTRRWGMDVEGLGIVYLEASASGLAVLAGRSGGAPDAVREGETGLVVDGSDIGAVADLLNGLLSEPDRRRAMGIAGRDWVEREWHWGRAAADLADILKL